MAGSARTNGTILKVTLADSNELEAVGSYIDLIASKAGYGRLICGDSVAYADFIFTTAGVVTLLTYSANVATTLQTGTNHVVIKDNGSNVRITNELGSSTTFNVTIQYVG